MREVYIKNNINSYECPYCKAEIVDCTWEKIETGVDYCGACLKEILIIVEDE